MVRRIKGEVIGVCSVLLALYLGLCFFSYEQWDPSFLTYTTKPASNYGGIVGAYISDSFFELFGISAAAIPVFLFVFGLKSFLGREGSRVHIIGAVLFLISGSLFATLLQKSFIMGLGGGMLGKYGSILLTKGFSVMGAYIAVIALLLSSLILMSPVSVIQLLLEPRRRRSDEMLLASGGYDEVPEDFDSGEYEAVATVPDARPLPEVEIELPSALRPEAPAEASPRAGSAPPKPPKKGGPYQLPGLAILSEYDPVERRTKNELIEESSQLEGKLQDFGVKGRVTQVHTGPVVTMFEFEPAPGVKINRVVSLSDDLALAMKAQNIRISTVPGKSTIGIEVPNRRRETVALREILSSEKFRSSKSKLTFALGKDIFGAPVVADLARMPHLLVAGATGAGKSVGLNSMIVSLLYKASPDEVKLLMIDPKLLELSAYEGIPHLLAPVVTNPKEAAEMLRRMVFEMERRYRLLAECGVRNIESFNSAVSKDQKLPYIVVFIDELADLMFASASQVEDSIARLAQMARASGIHLVLATQRPSVDVITGVIKANFPARIAFQVTSKIDSRTILDAQGAEQLIGRGDMLLMMPGVKTLRVHGAFLSEAEVRGVVEFAGAQGEPDFSIIRHIEQVEAETKAEAEYSEERDETYWKAVEVAEAMGEVSISSIQRKLKIGYNRAARIMELFEEEGLVGPPKGAGKPRDFLGRRNV